jgi:uncharacterized protein (DUF2062 family)
MSRNSLQKYPQRLPSAANPNSTRNPKLRGSKHSFKRRLQYFYWRLVRLRGRPEQLARGLACGVFAGLFPFFGSQTLLAVLLAVLLRGNKILAAVGPWISNPLTSVPIYAFNFQVGKWLLNDHTSTEISLSSWQDVKELGIEIIWPLFVGCVSMGLVCSIFSYFLGLWLIRRVRTSHHSRHRRKRLHRHYREHS